MICPCNAVTHGPFQPAPGRAGVTMMRHGLIELPPSELDLRLARGAARIARPWLERDAQLLTLLADEKLLLAVAGAAWLGTRWTGDAMARQRADHLALSSAASALLPHLLKQ